MKGLGNEGVTRIEVDDASEGQRIDNFLLRTLKGVPRSHIYRMVRGGEVRVNSSRIDQTYRLQVGDQVRIPPVRQSQPSAGARRAPTPHIQMPVLHEDDGLLIVDKPAHVAVHGGSGVSFGVIETLRAQRPSARFLELAHRLDRETSGVLVLAKRRSALTRLHELWRAGAVEKTYLALVRGRWDRARLTVDQPLQRYLTAEGERRVRPDSQGQSARTAFEVLGRGDAATLLEVHLETGRTHQIRVHLAQLGTPIVGDEKYGDFTLNKQLAKQGLGRMFLHASRMRFTHPLTGVPIDVRAPLPADLARVKDRLLRNDENSGRVLHESTDHGA